MEHPVSVLLISPGTFGGPDGNFGLPHLVALGSFLEARTDARVEIVDLDYERFLTQPDPQRAFDAGFAVIGISCYSSYEYLTAFYLGAELRRRNPDAVLVVGGYHASARPDDFLNLPASPLEEPSPFDHVVVGEGELPLARIVEAAAGDERLPEPVLGPEPLPDLDGLPPLNWSLLDRYRAVARRIGGQATLHFSRGCPFGCSFCMERSKGESAWRAWSPARAEAELRRLDAWLGLDGWKLFISDAVFGLDPRWRRETLERLARIDVGLDAIWTLTRADLLGPGDIGRYRRAGVGLGFGLESGDPEMLARMGKVRDADAFLDRACDVAAEAAREGLPWGGNLIAGHPGERAESLERSARFAERLFLGTEGLTGFVSIDPFRLYPGSEVDRELARYEEQFGTRVHRRRWWNYSEQSFTSEWVDPSRSLDYREREALTARLFEPVVRGVAERFAYRGPAADYFRRSVDRAVEGFGPASRLRTLADCHLWRGLTGESDARFIDDPEAQALFRRAREETLASIDVEASERVMAAVLDEPRERFVPEHSVLESWEDTTIPLAHHDWATVSALHAYLINYALLDLLEGDALVEIGGGTGYGAAIASRIVGPSGRVVTYELLPELAAQAERNLADRPNVVVVSGDGLAADPLPAFTKGLFACALREPPQRHLDALPEGGRLLAPLMAEGGGGPPRAVAVWPQGHNCVRPETGRHLPTQGGEADADQTLTLFSRVDGRICVAEHGLVRYVPCVGPA